MKGSLRESFFFDNRPQNNRRGRKAVMESSTNTNSNNRPKEDIMLNFEQQAAFQAIVNGKGNVLLTGNAGTGKSFVLKQAIQALEAQDQNVMVCATTGVAST